MAKEIVQIKNAATGNNRYPITIGSYIETETGGKFEDALIHKDSDGISYLGNRIIAEGHHYKLTELGYFRQYPATGAVQGGDVYGDKFYQFYDGGGLVIIDLVQKTYTYTTFDVSDFDSIHCGAVSFSNEFENEGDELPLVYLSGAVKNNAEYIAVYNINTANSATPHLVRYFVSHGIAAYDFENNRGWWFSYPENTSGGSRVHKGMNYMVREFNLNTGGSGDITNVGNYRLSRQDFGTSPSTSQQSTLAAATQISGVLPNEGIYTADEITEDYEESDKTTIDTAIAALTVGGGSVGFYNTVSVDNNGATETHYIYWSVGKINDGISCEDYRNYRIRKYNLGVVLTSAQSTNVAAATTIASALPEDGVYMFSDITANYSGNDKASIEATILSKKPSQVAKFKTTETVTVDETSKTYYTYWEVECMFREDIQVPNLGLANLQDCFYIGGNVYVLAGGAYNDYGFIDEVHIGKYNVLTKRWEANVKLPSFEYKGHTIPCLGESESIGIWNNKIVLGFIPSSYKSITHYLLDFNY